MLQLLFAAGPIVGVQPLIRATLADLLTSLLLDAAAADLQNLCLLGDRQIVLTVDHRFALSNPALVSAPSKKSFSSVSSPILACSDFTSTAAGDAPWPPPGPKTSDAPSSSCAFHDVI